MEMIRSKDVTQGLVGNLVILFWWSLEWFAANFLSTHTLLLPCDDVKNRSFRNR